METPEWGSKRKDLPLEGDVSIDREEAMNIINECIPNARLQEEELKSLVELLQWYHYQVQERNVLIEKMKYMDELRQEKFRRHGDVEKLISDTLKSKN